LVGKYEEEKIYLLFTAVPGYRVHCFILLVGVIDVIFCYILEFLDSILNFSGKKYRSSSASDLDEMDASIRILNSRPYQIRIHNTGFIKTQLLES
jgi:hypothetical protein